MRLTTENRKYARNFFRKHLEEYNLRYGERQAIHIAIDALNINPDELRPNGRWITNPHSEDGYRHHCCSHCKENAIFHYEYCDDFDEDMDGNWYVCGQRIRKINEFLTPACPNCGANLRGWE